MPSIRGIVYYAMSLSCEERMKPMPLRGIVAAGLIKCTDMPIWSAGGEVRTHGSVCEVGFGIRKNGRAMRRAF
jgi:hypothetical protein